MKTISLVMSVSVLFFLLGLMLEAYYSRKKNLKLYDPGDTYANLGCGIIQQIFSIFTKTAHLGAYIYVLNHFRLIYIEYPKWISFPLALILVDFAYYWAHRGGHRIGVLWAAHIVHHQSEYYNLSVALRQSVITVITGLPFFMPIALFGLGVTEYVAATLFTSLYQFWIHTQVVQRIGFLEKFLNTPSHHRVHHGINPRYLDKNYGATFIIWDKIFGTFAEETEPVSFGVTHTFASFNPVRANFSHWIDLWGNARLDFQIRTKSSAHSLWFLTSLLRSFIAPPDWTPGSSVTWKSEDKSMVLHGHAGEGARLKWWGQGQEPLLRLMAMVMLFSILGTVFILLRGNQMGEATLLFICLFMCGVLFLPPYLTKKISLITH